jgi:hypothetical protein
MGAIRSWRMSSTRLVEQGLRRARLLAAREYKPGSIPRRGILTGAWDGGKVVRKYLQGDDDA